MVCGIYIRSQMYFLKAVDTLFDNPVSRIYNYKWAVSCSC